MQQVLIVIHLLIVLALVGVVLLQRSEGGALGSGGGGGGFMTGRAQANALTRATGILATLFFITSLSLTILAGYSRNSKSILESVPAAKSANDKTAPAKTDGSPASGGFDLGKTLKDQEQKIAPAIPAAPAQPEAPVSK